MTSAWSLSVFLAFMMALLPKWSSALQCYRCDGLNQPISDCPGWIRRPIDSLRDLNDRGGLFTHCVDIRLANGTVLYQDLHPERPTCMGNFLSGNNWFYDKIRCENLKFQQITLFHGFIKHLFLILPFDNFLAKI